MSATNDLNSATTSNQFNDQTNNNDVSNLEIVFDLVGRLQELAPEIKKNHIVLSQQFTQFMEYLKDLKQLSAETYSVRSTNVELERELEEMKKDREEIAQRCRSNADDRVYLDVGGKNFTTTVKTLTENENSLFFKTLVSEQWDRDTNSTTNPIFIDRDGRLFDYVLKYLRTGELNVEDKITRKELLTEAKYFKLKSLEDQLQSPPKKELSALSTPFESVGVSPPCSPAPMTGRSRASPYLSSVASPSVTRSSPVNAQGSSKSTIHPSATSTPWRAASPITLIPLNVFVGSRLLNADYEEKLIEFLGLDAAQQRQPWRLVYRATEHGFDAADFHHRCDSLGPTLSIIQSDFGNIFGGFTSVSWSSAQQRTDQADEKAFLFTLKNAVSVPPTKFPVAAGFQESAISHNPTCGPNFGSPKNEGSDLCLRNNFSEKKNCVFFPKSYPDTSNRGGMVFATRYFACKEVEVFTPVRSST